MKKTLLLSILFLLLIALVCVVTGCGEEETPPTPTPDPTPTTFEVVFKAGDGTVLKTETVELGKAATAPEVPARVGFEFTGWDTDFSAVDCPLTVTAQYVRVWTVSFVDHDGTVLKTETVRDGSAATAPETTPTRENYTFSGWDKAFDNITADTTVTAQYTENAKYTVTFVDYDGTELKVETVYTGKGATAPTTNPTRENYTFSGWDKTFDNITADTTVTAQYTENAKYTVTFVDYDGAILGTDSVYGGEAATAPADPTRENYTFSGWDKAFDNITADTTVTAQYVENGKIKVTFVDYDGSVLGTDWVYEGQAATAPANPTRENYTFTGWDKTFDNITEKIVVTAQYTENAKYTVTFYDHDGTVLGTDEVYEGEAAEAPPSPTHTDYIFASWDKAFDNITADTVVTAQCTRAYTVTFVDHDGSELKRQQVVAGAAATAPANPSRVGYVFTGWDIAFANVTSDLTVTAQYTIVKYNVSFNTQGGGDIATQMVAHGATATKPADPTREGFDFLGWQVGGKDYDFATPVTADITIIAVYKSNGEVPAATNTTLVLDPGYLEVWRDMSLRLNIKPNGANSVFLDKTDATFDFISTDSSILTVAGDGTFTTYDKVGTVQVYAVTTKGATLTVSGVNYTAAVGDILGAITIKVVDYPEYYKQYLENDDQKITLGSTDTPRIDKNDFLSYPTGDYGDANIALWYNGTEAVFTMTVDDNSNTPMNSAAWETWRQTYGIPVTYIVWSGSTSTSDGTLWQQVVSQGHAVQSHGANHVQITNDITNARVWHDLYFGQQQINEASGNPSLIIGYAFGTNMAELSSMLYIAGRGTEGHGNGVADVDYNQTNSYSGFPSGGMAAQLESMLGANATNGWISVHYHTIGNTSATIESNYAAMKSYIDSGKLWAALFSDVAQYGQERDTATLTILEAGANTIRLTVTDEMNDILYYHPLSVRIKVDSTWQYARAYQNGKEVNARIIENGGNTYVMVDAIPDMGEVTVVRTELSGMTQTDSAITFTPTDTDDTMGNTMTYGFIVNGETWKYVYATQNGTVIPATVKTETGVTRVYVTFTVGGGAVSVVPVTDQYDALSTYTMTLVAKGMVAPDPNKVITISTPRELILFSAYVNAGNSLAGYTVRLTQDLDMSDIDFDPIGFAFLYTSDSTQYRYIPFSGTFDGNGKTIANLYVKQYEGQAGLFGYTKDATIMNLHVEGDINGVWRTGGIVGYMSSTTLTGVTFSGNVTVQAVMNNANTGSYVGGLVGYMGSGTIEHSGFTGNVKAVGTKATATANQVGGIVGTMFLGTVNNCSVSGTVTAEGYGENSGNYVGGIIGLPTGTDSGTKKIINCTVNAVVSGNVYVGGIAGAAGTDSSGRPLHLHNNAVSGTVTGNEFVGGIAGRASGGGAGSILNNLANATVTGADGAQYVGIIVGGRDAENYGIGIYSNRYVEGMNPNLPTLSLAGGALNTGHTNPSYESAAAALDALNTYAANNGLFAWRLVDNVPSPTYKEIFTVIFLDRDGNILSTQIVVGGADATAPTPPTLSGFVFTGWDKAFTAVSSNLTVQAQYEIVVTHTVTFLGKDGETLKTETVNDGFAATAPTAPAVDGYRFNKWDKVFDNITGDLVVTAQYVKTWTVTYLKKDNSVYKIETYDEGTVPTMPEGPTEPGYAFVKWNPETLAAITANVTVTPVYEAKASAAVDYTIAHWSIGNNAISGNVGAVATLAGYMTADLGAIGGADIFILSGGGTGYLPKGTFGKAGYTYFPEAQNDSLHALFYNANVFSVGGAATYMSLANGKITYEVFPLQNADGLIIPVVSVYIAPTATTSDAATLLTSLSTALGDTADCAIIRVHVAQATADAASGWQASLTTTTADASGKVFTAAAGVDITKSGTKPTNNQNTHYSYLITYSSGAPTTTVTGETMVPNTDDTSRYPNTSKDGKNTAFYTESYSATLSIGAFGGEE